MEFVNDLDILGQQPLLKIYTQICLCFPVNESSSHLEIIRILTSGLERLSKAFPWIAGKVVEEASADTNLARAQIKSSGEIPRLVVKDFTQDASIPSMDALRQAKFPFAMLDENIICPVNTIPNAGAGAAPASAPVFLLQANFIVGGLLLTLNGEHRTMDMTGQGQVIDLLNKACRNEVFSSEELQSGNLNRLSTLPLLDKSYKPGKELEHQILKQERIMSPQHRCIWSYFIFSRESLVVLKSLAAQNVSPAAGYISTDDTLTAFVWKSITRARLSRLSPETMCKCARAVDVRRYLEISPTYPGLMQNMTYHTYAIESLIEEPLGATASQLRTAILPESSNLGYNTRALATFFHYNQNKGDISLTASIDPSTDIMLSSWAKLDCYQLDFNLGLGKPEAVRRPRFVPCESLLYLMPPSFDGEIAVAICLREEDMDKLKLDEDFTRYGTFLG